MTTIIWIIVAVIVLALIVAAIAFVARGRREKQHAARAEELRSHAAEHDQQLAEERRQAAEAEAQAELARAEAERADERAREAHESRLYEEARHEDTLREADRLDPHVDEKAAAERFGERPAESDGSHRREV